MFRVLEFGRQPFGRVGGEVPVEHQDSSHPRTSTRGRPGAPTIFCASDGPVSSVQCLQCSYTTPSGVFCTWSCYTASTKALPPSPLLRQDDHATPTKMMFWMRCSVRCKPSVSEVAGSACCKREKGMNKVHSLLNNSKSSMTNHKNRSIAILLRGSEPQEDTSSNFEGYWNAKHPGGIAIKIKICTSWTQIPESEGQR